MAGRKLDIEPRHQGVNEVVSSCGQGKWYAEGQVGGGAFVQVQDHDAGGVGNHGFHLNSVDKGLGESGLFEGRVVETVNIIPDCPNVSCQTLISQEGRG